MRKYDRIFIIVLDSLGIGEMPDAAAFGDAGADTFGHVVETSGTLAIPNLTRLGMLSLHPCETMPEPDDMEPIGVYARLGEASNGKDTMCGHWEMMGIKTDKPFKTFPAGFPQKLIDELAVRCGHKVIGNKVASGTVILDELGEQSVEQDAMIVYTSADSVLQIAANEDTFGLDELYRCCEIARELTLSNDEWRVGRVIARPFTGTHAGEFVRTANRHDYALEPPIPTVLDELSRKGYDVISVGKINDIFSGKGITRSYHSDSSVHGMQQTNDVCVNEDFVGLCFVNLVDFDSKWGHRRNPKGYGEEIERFDERLGILLDNMRERDLLIITADHGNDPTYKGTDHTREYVPFIAYSPAMQASGAIDEQDTFAVIGATVADNFELDMPEGLIGDSILHLLG